jgi:hypothetical protein
MGYLFGPGGSRDGSFRGSGVLASDSRNETCQPSRRKKFITTRGWGGRSGTWVKGSGGTGGGNPQMSGAGAGETISSMRRDILLFIKAVGRHWWALLSCAGFTVLSWCVAEFSKKNDWVAHGILILAGFFLLVSCFLAWKDERGKVTQLPTDLAQWKKDHDDDRPLLGINIDSEKGAQGWREAIDSHNQPVRFHIQHLSGRVATSVHFDPIISKGCKFSLQFHALAHVEPPVQKIMYFEFLEDGQLPSAKVIRGIGLGR